MADPVNEPHDAEAARILEALLMVAEEPADVRLLAELLEMAPAAVEELLVHMAAGYEAESRGFALVKVAGGWRFQSHEAASAYVERYILSGQTARLSAAALETLAIVAYKQPISRAQIASIRGVNADGVVRTLTQRGYIAEVGQDPGPGQAILLGTTSLFLERLGLDSVDELPSLGDFIPDAEVVELLEHGLRLDAEPGDAPGAGDASGPHDDPDQRTVLGQGGTDSTDATEAARFSP